VQLKIISTVVTQQFFLDESKKASSLSSQGKQDDENEFSKGQIK